MNSCCLAKCQREHLTECFQVLNFPRVIKRAINQSIIQWYQIWMLFHYTCTNIRITYTSMWMWMFKHYVHKKHAVMLFDVSLISNRIRFIYNVFFYYTNWIIEWNIPWSDRLFSINIYIEFYWFYLTQMQQQQHSQQTKSSEHTT